MSTTRRNINDLRLSATRKITYLRRHVDLQDGVERYLVEIQRDVDDLAEQARLLIPEGE